MKLNGFQDRSRRQFHAFAPWLNVPPRRWRKSQRLLHMQRLHTLNAASLRRRTGEKIDPRLDLTPR